MKDLKVELEFKGGRLVGVILESGIRKLDLTATAFPLDMSLGMIGWRCDWILENMDKQQLAKA